MLHNPIIFYHHPNDFLFILLLHYYFLLYFVVDNYDWLVNGTAQALVEKFMEEKHSFDEYTEVTNQKSLIGAAYVIDLLISHDRQCVASF